MGKRTYNALMARGFDSETANRLDSARHTINSLKLRSADELAALNISEKLIRTISVESRPPIPSEILNKVLYQSRMTCCVCRDKSQGIIVHHIHEYSDSRSHAEDNLVVLCLNHHGEAHTKRALQLNLTAARLRALKKRWLESVKQFDVREAASADGGYSYQDMMQISAAIRHSISTRENLNTPKFSFKIEELPDGRTSRVLTKEDSDKIVWELIQFPVSVGGYSTQSVATNDQLIISNFGSNCLLFYKFEDKQFTPLNLDSHEAGDLALLSERKRSRGSPVIRRYPPGDMIIAGAKLFVGQVFSEFVVVIDLRSREIIKRIPVGGEGKFAYSHKHDRVYFASNTANAFFVIDPTTYKFETVPYPEPSLNAGAAFCHPDSGLAYLGLHRTSKRDRSRRPGEVPSEANSFISIYDPSKGKYVSQVELAVNGEDKLERCWTTSMMYASSEDLLYIGMLGSPTNIYLFDTGKNQVSDFIRSPPNGRNKNDYADSLSLAFYKHYLFSVNRSNYELAVIDRITLQHLTSIPLGGTSNGPNHICVHEDRAYISHSEYDGLIAVNL